jgi:hypothetical protein
MNTHERSLAVMTILWQKLMVYKTYVSLYTTMVQYIYLYIYIQTHTHTILNNILRLVYNNKEWSILDA